MIDWKIRLEEKLKKSVVELTGNISYINFELQTLINFFKKISIWLKKIDKNTCI